MPRRYKDIYPSLPLLNSDEQQHISAASLMSLRYFQAEPDRMPEDVFAEHHVLLNLQETPHRVQNRRDGEMHDFTFKKNDIVVTPAGVRSGWRWFDKSDVIVVTLDPVRVEKFAQTELSMLLDDQQLRYLPLFSDADLCAAGVMLRDALEDDGKHKPPAGGYRPCLRLCGSGAFLAQLQTTDRQNATSLPRGAICPRIIRQKSTILQNMRRQLQVTGAVPAYLFCHRASRPAR